MEKEKLPVIFTAKAEDSIFQTKVYIFQKGYPETAEKYANRLYDFGYSLAAFPEKYPLCKRKAWTKRNYRCAVFDKTYVFIYKVVKSQVVIYNVIHGKRLK